ncbi:MAG: Na/Pi cotransporter family protein [Clostridiales bacterium]|jgi:phosphate:Na+ symporter|nr:Na/Pi cotransporter family protein [Clostridiales bacterium]
MSGNDYVQMMLQFVGGLGLFIYGMHVMASGLQKSAGNRMKRLLGILTKTKFLGVLVGAGVTAIIQSSSATTVMVVGFVNAGLMNLTQSVGIIMGANIGTTATAWLVSSMEWSKFLNPGTLAPIAVAVGAAMVLFVNNNKAKQFGEIIVGFGILFMGMTTMSDAVKPLSEVQLFKDAFVALGSNPILGLLAGAVITGIIQSSSASVGILQALALSGLVPWNAAVYIIMGQNIGTCVTALLSSMGASKNAKSAAYIHLLFNIIGSVVFSVIAIIYFSFINAQFGQALISVTEISIVHSAFNFLNTLLLYNFSNQIIYMAQRLAANGMVETDEAALVHLDNRILATPSFAIENSVKEIVRMANIALENLRMATDAVIEKNEEKIETVLKREKTIDALERAITQYLVNLCNADITEEENRIITALFHTVNDIERVGDHCENISELAQFSIMENVSLSDEAMGELKKMIGMTVSCFENSIRALEKNDQSYANTVKKQEDQIDLTEGAFRAAHIKRLTNNECSAVNGVLFLDTLTNLERISDHSLNIAQLVLKEN